MGAEKRAHILETAERLFSEGGYDGTSMRDIADAAGINVSMIFYYFGSKEKLLEALFEHGLTVIAGRINSVLQSDHLSPIEKLQQIIAKNIERAIQQQQFYKIVLTEQIIAKNPAVAHIVSTLKTLQADAFRTIILEGQQKNIFKKQDIDAVFILNTLAGTIANTVIDQQFYCKYHRLGNLSTDEFNALIQPRLTRYLDTLLALLLITPAA
jgi:AcrR family transcriptional regulator